MNSMIDYIGSMVTGALVFMTMLTYYGNVTTTSMMQVFNTTTQEDLTSITEVLEYDFKKAGYGVTDSVRYALMDSNRVSIRGDVNNDGTVDTVRYWVSYVSSLGGNAPTATLYRKTGNRTVRVTGNTLRRFRLWYYNGAGAVTTNPKEVRSVRVALNIEGKYTITGETPAGVYWERVIKSQNAR